MTKQEWIDHDLSFYHITHTRNLPGIYQSGLQDRNGRGICVVRTNNELIVRYICEMMLNINNDLDYSIIEIRPSQIDLLAAEILNDGVEECTDPLHNYINRAHILITAENVIGTYQANQLGINNLQEYEARIRGEFPLEQLT